MKPARRHNYKALYLSCSKQNMQKDQLIGLLQQQVTELANQHQILGSINQEQHHLIVAQKDELINQQTIITLNEQTISGLAEKSAQQEIIINQQDTLITDQQRELERNKNELQRLDELRHELRVIKKMVYGISSEKRHMPTDEGKPKVGGQLSLLLEVDAWGVCQISGRRRIPGHMRVLKSTTPQKRGGRHDFPPGLDEEITVINPDNKPANGKCVGHVDQRQLACDPVRWYIKIIRRLVYLAPVEDQLKYKQIIAPLPPHPIARCKMDVSVLVMLTCDKYLYHLPVWRQRQRFLQYGIDLPYSTLCNLTNRSCEALEPLWHLLLKEITVSGLVHVDETTFRVLDNTKKKGKKSHIGWMWATMNPMQRIACFMYQQGRGKKDIRHILQGYKGYLMTDAYGAYTKYGRQPGVTHQQCLSHARRYFTYALENDTARAGYALDHFFGPLYDIEEECKLLQLDYDAITDKRQSESLPILQEFHQWLTAELPKTIARTPIHKAIAYTLNHFDALTKYSSDGILQIDNNQLEGQIRRIALGRNNYLFAGSHRGGELAAIIYSFIATCKLQNIDPAKWLDDVLRRIVDHPEDKLIELLPQFWKPSGKVKQITA
jgi:transposase